MTALSMKYLSGFVVALLLMGGGFIACDDPYANSVDYAKLEAGETELREMFYNSVKDTIPAVETIDRMETEGWVAFIMEKGSDDPIQVGRRVSFRYTYSTVFRDVEDGYTTAVAIVQYSNYNSPELVEYTVGALSNTQSEVFQGVDLAMRHMNLYGKAYIIMVHSLAQNDYYPWVAEIEVVSTQLD
ncbi:hypothetical protein [Geofilum rhodophaeum]|uniref:hypothetical protein n=1 Tax=Geofilum rhodophaeum TaxID=1965019 RepID=UPI0011BA733C|nr:hypothetical protein [Geofilum rhodophaeum]